MIGSAKQDGSVVRVYDEKGNQLFYKNGTLIGYTGSAVTIKDSVGSTQRTFDEKGNQLSWKMQFVEMSVKVLFADVLLC